MEQGQEIAALINLQVRKLDSAADKVAIGVCQCLKGLLDQAADCLQRFGAEFRELLKDCADCLAGFADHVVSLLLVHNLGLLPVTRIREPATV